MTKSFPIDVTTTLIIIKLILRKRNKILNEKFLAVTIVYTEGVLR